MVINHLTQNLWRIQWTNVTVYIYAHNNLPPKKSQHQTPSVLQPAFLSIKLHVYKLFENEHELWLVKSFKIEKQENLMTYLDIKVSTNQLLMDVTNVIEYVKQSFWASNQKFIITGSLKKIFKQNRWCSLGSWR